MKVKAVTKKICLSDGITGLVNFSVFNNANLDESLGWDRDCYEAFARMLAGKTSVTGSMIDVYRDHHPPYKRLVERIASTDELIDQIVYRLYGLSDGEIAVAGGKQTIRTRFRLEYWEEDARFIWLAKPDQLLCRGE
jgi:hypothetical protein